MPISTQLTRLAQNVGAINADTNAIFEALRAKGVDVPANAQLSDVADMIESIVPPQTYVTIGGRQYKTVTIGNQEWLAENLDYKFDVNGSTLPIGSSGNPTTPAAWYYNNDESSYGIDVTYKCGLLYNWYAAKYLDDNKSILLPEGWRVSSSNDWEVMLRVTNGATSSLVLKAIPMSITSDWPLARWNGTDDYGFKVTPSGIRNYQAFNNFNSATYYWTKDVQTYPPGYIISETSPGAWGNGFDKTAGLYIRLVKDVT